MGILATIKLKKQLADICIFDVIIYKLNHWEEANSIILLWINKNSKINFYYTILTFDLVINLRVQYS